MLQKYLESERTLQERLMDLDQRFEEDGALEKQSVEGQNTE